MNVALLGDMVFADVINLKWDHTGLGWALVQMTDIFINRRKLGQRQTERENHVMTEADTGVMKLQARKHQGHQENDLFWVNCCEVVRFLLHVDSFVYVCECHAAPASFVEKITFASLYFLCSILKDQFSSLQSLSSVWLCNPMDWSMPGFPVHHQLPEPTQTHVHWVGDAIQPSHPLSSPPPPAFNFPSIRIFSNESVLLIRWPKCWEFQLQHQSFQWIFKIDFL